MLLFEKFTKIYVIYNVNWIWPPPPPPHYSPGCPGHGLCTGLCGTATDFDVEHGNGRYTSDGGLWDAKQPSNLAVCVGRGGGGLVLSFLLGLPVELVWPHSGRSPLVRLTVQTRGASLCCPLTSAICTLG